MPFALRFQALISPVVRKFIAPANHPMRYVDITSRRHGVDGMREESTCCLHVLGIFQR